jgi:hypothetical protein
MSLGPNATLAEAAPPSPQNERGNRIWMVGIALTSSLGLIMAMLDLTAVNVALADREIDIRLSRS